MAYNYPDTLQRRRERSDPFDFIANGFMRNNQGKIIPFTDPDDPKYIIDDFGTGELYPLQVAEDEDNIPFAEEVD